jgi:hypothetical protein
MTIKLYKSTSKGMVYWQAWKDGAYLAVQEGKLGVWGKARLVRPPRGTTPKQLQASLAKEKKAAGYAPISDADHHWVIVQYKLTTWGSAKDLDKAEKLDELFNACLAWTGNGYCDGNDIGSGEMNLFCVVVDPKLAAKTIVAELKKKPRLLAGAVVAIREGEEHRVVHPPRFKGKFAVQ